MYMALLIGSVELTGIIKHNNKEAFSTQNEAYITKLANMSKKICIHCLVYPVVSSLSNAQIMTQTWTKHNPSNGFFLSLNQYAQGCFISNFRFLDSRLTDIFNFLTHPVSSSDSQ